MASDQHSNTLDAATLARVRGVRIYATVWATTIVGVMIAEMVGAFELPVPTATALAVAGPLTLINIVSAVTPWHRIADRRWARLAMEAYPLAVTIGGVWMLLFEPWSLIWVLTLITAVALGAVTSRPPTMALVFALSLVGLLGAGLRDGGPAAPEVINSAVTLVTVGALAWETVRQHRRATDQAEVARQAAEQRVGHLTALAQASARVQALDGSEVMQALAEATVPLGWEMCAFYLADPEGDPDGDRVAGKVGLPTLGDPPPRIGVFGKVLATGRPTVHEDYGDRVDVNPEYVGLITCAAGVPVRVRGRLRGALVVGHTSRDRIAPGEVQTLELLAGMAGRALELAEEHDDLRRLDRLKDDFVSTVSHELRTPLAVVVGLSETMSNHGDRLTDGLRDDMVDRLLSNSQALKDVIETLLDFSRLRDGQTRVERQVVDVAALARETVRRLAPGAPDHVLEVAGADAFDAEADPILLDRVLENLVGNACRHTPEGTTVVVTVEPCGHAVRVAVRDDGPGIPAEELGQVTERFYRGGEADRRPTRGLGIGLALCAEILELHGSELEVTSTPGEGATFAFVLAGGGRTDDVESPQADSAQPIGA